MDELKNYRAKLVLSYHHDMYKQIRNRTIVYDPTMFDYSQPAEKCIPGKVWSDEEILGEVKATMALIKHGSSVSKDTIMLVDKCCSLLQGLAIHNVPQHHATAN